MTIEEALRQLRGAGRCFVVFDAGTGEVLEIHAAGDLNTPDTLVSTMGDASAAHGAVMGRYVDGADVTREMLEQEVEAAHSVAQRVAAFSRWAVLEPAALMSVLETEEFASPMDLDHGPSMVIERLFDYPPEVLRPFVPRLERIADVSSERGFGVSAQRRLESKLAVLAGSFEQLKQVWLRVDSTMFSGLVWHPDLLADIGDLRPREPEPIEILINTVSYPDLWFSSRSAALVSLGKVGAPAGPRASSAIRGSIFDSERWIVELRERVLERIETPESAWVGCPRCYRGSVPGRRWLDDDRCGSCLGLGVVRAGDV